MKKIFLIASLVILVGTYTASADTISGIPTLNGDTSPVFTGNPIEFFIPLAGNDGGIYGADNGSGGQIGMSSDSFTINGSQIDGALLDMYLHFAIPTDQVGTSLTLLFDDLDLRPNNDPDGFFEKLTLYGEYDLPAGTYTHSDDLDSLADVSVTYLDPGTNNSMEIVFSDLSIMPGGGDFWWHLGLEAYSVGLDGTWTNTVEKLSAQMETAPVPEPATMLLFGTGLTLLGGAFLRKNKKI